MGHLPNTQRYLGHTSINSHSDPLKVGGLLDFSVTPSPNWTFGFGTSLGFGLGGLDLGLRLRLDNNDVISSFSFAGGSTLSTYFYQTEDNSLEKIMTTFTLKFL